MKYHDLIRPLNTFELSEWLIAKLKKGSKVNENFHREDDAEIFLKSCLVKSPQPIVGNDYLPVTVAFYFMQQTILVTEKSSLTKLDAIQGDHLIFGRDVFPYPDEPANSGIGCMATLLFASKVERDQLMIEIKFNYPEFDIKFNTI